MYTKQIYKCNRDWYAIEDTCKTLVNLSKVQKQEKYFKR